MSKVFSSNSMKALLVAVVSLIPSTALAADGTWTEVHGYYFIDFLVFVGALYYFVKKPLAAFLEQRRADAAKEIDEAAEIRAKAEERLARYEKQLASLDETRVTLTGEFTEDGESEKARLVEEAKEQGERLERDLARSIQQESAKLSESLEGRLANRALELAEDKITAKLTAPVQQALVAQFIADLGRIDSLADFDANRAQG